MEERVKRLEDRFDRIESKLDKFSESVSDLREAVAGMSGQMKHFATKADLSSATNKIYGAIALGVLAVILKEYVPKLLQ